MRNQGGFAVLWAMLGVLAALSLAITGDQVLQNVYDSANTALRVNVVAGGSSGSGTVSSGTTNVLAKYTAATTVGNSSITDNGTTISSSEALSVGALAYNGKLTITDIGAENASFTVAHRIAYVTTGASAIAATMPASPATGDTYTIVKADSGAGTVVWTRAGSQTLNGATTRTVSAQYKSDTCVYMASNVWICQGDGA